MILIFYFLGAIAIWLGIQSVLGGLRFLAYVRRDTALPLADYTPFVSVIAPFRGVDQGLSENLSALFNQEYPSYEIVFVTDSREDPALPLVEKLRTKLGPARGIGTRVIIAGEATDCGQKVHNLRQAVAVLDHQTEVIVFVDTDARPHAKWLQLLVAALSNESTGAATGYRWFLPLTGGLAAHLRSVWNASIASALGAREDKNFCWGGSTAIRRTRFEELKISERWRGTVSDDFTMTRALHEAKLPIHFVPQCLTASFEDCTFRALFEFTNRQLKITRVYAPHLWQAVLLGSLIFVLAFFGGSLFVIIRATAGLGITPPVIVLAVIFGLGATKAWIRVRAVNLAMADYGAKVRRSTLAHLLLWPWASLLFLANAFAAAFSRRIGWRGIGYELKSPTEAVIITRER